MLHVVYTRKNGTKEDLVHLEVSAGGKVGADAVALGGWSSMSHPDLLRMPDGFAPSVLRRHPLDERR